MKNIDFYCELAEKYGFDFKKDILLKDYTTFKAGGKAALVVFPQESEKLSDFISELYENNSKPLILGKGSNVLVSDNGFDGIVIITERLDKIELIAEDTVKCSAGVSLMKLCRFCLENSLSGLEFAFGIPGSVGGALYMNAGAYGGEMKDVVLEAEHISENGEKGSFKADELDLSYRHSVYSGKNYIITSVTVKLKKDNQESIKEKMNGFLSSRKEKQPLEYPSAGSTFKRPEGYFAGALIEQ